MWFQPAWHPIRHLRRRLLPSGTQPGRRYDALGADVRDAERLTRDIDAAMSDMRFVIRPHAGPNILLPAKLDLLGIDPGYLEVADSEAFKALGAACDRCPNWRRCARDLARGDATTGLKGYCLNAAAIDALVIERLGGGTTGRT